MFVKYVGDSTVTVPGLVALPNHPRGREVDDSVREDHFRERPCS